MTCLEIMIVTVQLHSCPALSAYCIPEAFVPCHNYAVVFQQWLMNSAKTHILSDLKELCYRKCCFFGRKHGSVGKKLCHVSVRTWTWNLRTYVCNPNTPVVRWEVKIGKLQLSGQLTYCTHRNTSKESGTDTWGCPMNSTYVHVQEHTHTHTAKIKEKENSASKIEVPQNLTGEFLG